MHYDDQDVVVMYVLIKNFLRELRVFEGGIHSNSSPIVFYCDCHLFSSKSVGVGCKAAPDM